MNSHQKTSNPNLLPNLVQSHLHALRSAHFRRLDFDDLLERMFEARLAPSRARRLYLEGWIMVAMYCLLLVGDYHTLGGRFHLALLVRCLFALPLLFIANDVHRHKPGKVLREGSVVLTVCLVTATNLMLWFHVSAVVSATAVVSTVIGLIASSVVMRLRFPYALATTGLTLAMDGMFLVHDSLLRVPEKTNAFMPVAIAGIFTLAASYSLEREERLAFLLHTGNELQQQELQLLNVKLERLSSMDGLTGLTNRAAFDQRFAAALQEAYKAKAPLAAILIDIDHFKRVNDTLGHLYGDEVLKRVAFLIGQSVRGYPEFAARYGGEEFVVLLPNTTAASATNIAERIRRQVQESGPVCSESRNTMWTTVSCGVAGIDGVSSGTSALDLLREADQALYRAKASGRNRVCEAFTQTTPLAEPGKPGVLVAHGV